MATFSPLVYVLLLIVLLAYARADGVEVHIISSTPPSKCNCTLNANTTGHIICPHLSTALENCKSNETSNLTFILYNQDNIETSLSYEVSNTVHIQSNGADENAPYTIQCIDYKSLEFTSSLGNNQSVLSFDNIQFFDCGNSVKIGMNISGVYSVNINQASFQYMFGLSILNAVDVDIRNSNFKYCKTNPYAPLQITYNNSMISDADEDINHTITLFNCHFESNHDVSDYSSKKGLSGVFVVSFPYLQDKTFMIVLLECYFDSNDLKYFSYRSPMLYVLNSTNLNIQFTIENSSFTYNKGLAVAIESSPLFHNEEFIVRLFNNLFLNNINPLSDSGLVHMNISSDFVTLNYEQLNFVNNIGTLLTTYSSNNAASNHTLNGCSFHNNVKYGINIVEYLISFKSQGKLFANNVTLKNLTYTVGGPKVNSDPYLSDTMRSIFHFRSVNLVAEDLNLTGRDNVVATMFNLEMVNAVFNGKNTFYYNEGDHGGGLAMNGSNLTITEGSTLTFNNNNAFYGGAMYINTTHFNTALICNGKINFTNNVARIAGHSIYTTDTNINIDSFKNCFEVTKEIVTSPKYFTATINQKHSFFPGQFIFLSVSLVDGLGNPGTCIAKVSLKCNKTDTGETGFCERLYPNLGLQLMGPKDIFLFGRDKTVNTLLRFGAQFGTHFNINETTRPWLYISCSDPPMDAIKQDFAWNSSCPLGFNENSISKVCECHQIKNKTMCPLDSGVACIKNGYWTDGSIAVKCSYPLCDSRNLRETPETQICQQYYGQQVIALPQSPDDQCSTNRGGRRCSRCRDGYNLTFLGTKCTNNCNTPLYPIIITLLTIVFQFMIALFILAAMRIKLEIGAGFMHGPLIFLAIIGQMRLGYYHILKVIVSSITSVYLVNLEIFGEIPWCFGIPDTKLLLIKSFYYLGPLLVWIILLLLVGMGRCCPRLLDKIQDSPMQAICLLMMLSFWSMTDSSIHMLEPLIIEDSWYTAEDPYAKYFEGGHVVAGLAAIAIISLAILPFISVLAMSNFELPSRIFRLHRFKPIFDEFQSCYVDKHRWYCVVYYISFILYLILVFAGNPLGPQLLLVLLLSLHFVVQPYKKHILNIIDMLLLLDLLVLYSLLEKEEELEDRKTIYTSVLVHMMTLIPLLYVVVGTIGIFCLQCKHRLKIKSSRFSIQWRKSQSQPSRSIRRTELIMDDDEGEREPLIGIIQADDEED